MEISAIIPHIEALIFASDKPLHAEEIRDLINKAMGFLDDQATAEQVEQALDGICEKYNSVFFPFEVKKSGGGYQFLTKPAYHETIAVLNGERYLKKLSASALETLSIIAYKQPVTKGEIEQIRGVNCDYAVQKLLEKELVIITGRRENAPGQPLVYETSKTFMDYFGINSKDDLPRLSEVAEQVSIPTGMNPLESTSEAIERIFSGNAHPGTENHEEMENTIKSDDGEDVQQNEEELDESIPGNAIISDDGDAVYSEEPVKDELKQDETIQDTPEDMPPGDVAEVNTKENNDQS